MQTAPAGTDDPRTFMRVAVRFLCVGLVCYGAVYAGSERLVYRYGLRNRFMMVKTAPHVRYDAVILGASHAAVLDYDDMNARLESMTGSRILNLSIVGAGPVVNRLALEYFLVGHRARAIVYVADSFAFHSPDWNERRLDDVRLFQRAPFDPSLARLLWRSPASVRTSVTYVSGFAKINNANRFRPEGEGESARFDRIARPAPQLDRERVAYLYPYGVDGQARAFRDRYLAELEALIERGRSEGGRVAIVRPPLPKRFRALLPAEAEFDAALLQIAGRTGAAFHDFSGVASEDKFFYDTDHLNRTGVLVWVETHLAAVLRSP